MKQSEHRICDYEGSPYRRVFWEEADRSYEDQAERLVLRALLPQQGRRIVEIGAGFGRLVDEYRGYDQVILLDYARSMLTDARERLGDAYTYVCADLYRLPFADQSLDTVTQIRVLHHVEHIEDAFDEVARSLCAGGSYVLEFANKRNAKAIARKLTGAQDTDPFSEEPLEFVELNWNFHPRHVERALRASGLEPRERRAASHFRIPALKRMVPAAALARIDSLLGAPLAPLAPSPSQFVRSARLTGGALNRMQWRCLACGHGALNEETAGLRCPECDHLWPLIDGVYQFR